jgi:hypothetical protein
MAEAFAKFRVGTPGSGAAHASYITRASALEPNYDKDHGSQLDLNLDDVSVAAALDDPQATSPATTTAFNRGTQGTPSITSPRMTRRPRAK